MTNYQFPDLTPILWFLPPIFILALWKLIEILVWIVTNVRVTW